MHRRDRSEDEAQFEKWEKELTFKPNISGGMANYNVLKDRTDRQSNLDNILNEVPDFDKAVYRMYEGRKVRADSVAKMNGKSSPEN